MPGSGFLFGELLKRLLSRRTPRGMGHLTLNSSKKETCFIDGILLDALIQAGALGVVAYIVMQWKHEDDQQAQQQLGSLMHLVIYCLI